MQFASRVRSGGSLWRVPWPAAALVAIVLLAACQPIQAPDAMAPEAEEAATEPQAMPQEGNALPEGNADAGELIRFAALGCGCHFNNDLGALAGGNAFEGDFGVVYSRNLTPDAETGIGNFTDEQLADAIRFGKGADGRNLFIMPRYSGMADQDVADLIAYLRSQEPVVNEVPSRELAFEPPAFVGTEAPPATAPAEPAEWGEYIVAIATCARCHTPLNEDGSMNMDLFLAGAPFRDTVAPNLTPDEATGTGMWTDEELAEFLATGAYSDGSEAMPAMKSVIDNGIGRLTDEHRQAIVAYLRSLPAVVNEPAPAQ